MQLYAMTQFSCYSSFRPHRQHAIRPIATDVGSTVAWSMRGLHVLCKTGRPIGSRFKGGLLLAPKHKRTLDGGPNPLPRKEDGDVAFCRVTLDTCSVLLHRHPTHRNGTIRDAVLTCARKLT